MASPCGLWATLFPSIPSEKGHPPAVGVRRSGLSLVTLFSGDSPGAEQGGETKTGDPSNRPRAPELSPGPARHSQGPCCPCGCRLFSSRRCDFSINLHSQLCLSTCFPR